jgi:ADP-ribosylglycohydrolase
VRFRVYRAAEPWGDDWDQAAVIASSICNRLQSRGRVKLEDFRPNYKRRSKPSSAEIEATIMQFFQADGR